MKYLIITNLIVIALVVVFNIVVFDKLNERQTKIEERQEKILESMIESTDRDIWIMNKMLEHHYQ